MQSGRDAFVMHHWDTGKNKADNILINGRGLDFSGSASATSSRLPPAVFEVEEGKRHRFRVASPGFTLCPIQARKKTLILAVVNSVKILLFEKSMVIINIEKEAQKSPTYNARGSSSSRNNNDEKNRRKFASLAI